MTRPIDPVPRPSSARVLVVDADPALLALLQEWLGELGCSVVRASAPAAQRPAEAAPFDLAIVDLPMARLAAEARLRKVRQDQPGTPILALSASVLPGVHACGPVARALGVDAILASPASRRALTEAVVSLLVPR